MAGDSVDEQGPARSSGRTTALATAGGGLATLLVWAMTTLGGVQKDVTRVETVVQAQDQRITAVAARVDRTENVLADVNAKIARMLAILERVEARVEQERGAAK